MGMIHHKIQAKPYISVQQVANYICAYQKNYEQYVKNGTEVEDTEIKNRFEIRMKNERAYYAVVDLLTYRDAERTAFLSSIIMSVL